METLCLQDEVITQKNPAQRSHILIFCACGGSSVFINTFLCTRPQWQFFTTRDLEKPFTQLSKLEIRKLNPLFRNKPNTG
jgi:hypothetical protein